MEDMFRRCTDFNYPLNWSISGLTAGNSQSRSLSLKYIFYNCGISSENYSATLMNWASQVQLNSKPYYIDVGGVSNPSGNLIAHTTNADDAYLKLTTSPIFWTIQDGGILTTPMILTITNPASEVTIPITGSVTVDWGDGTLPDANVPHTYASGDRDYTISITGTASAYGGTESTINTYLTAVVQWGNLGITDYSNAFYYCPNNFTLPTQQLTGVTNMEAMFYGCTAFNQPITFDTSQVESMKYMFQGCENFNEDISFNTIKVENMTGMFESCIHFNSQITFTDTSAVESMQSMFRNCTNFNKDISFNTIKVTDMFEMFLGCNRLNRPITLDTSTVKNMSFMFQDCTDFNKDISFNTPLVDNMEGMFLECTTLNSQITLNTSAVTEMQSMFYGCRDFNQDISFNTPLARSMDAMFIGCTTLNSQITLNTSAVKSMQSMFEGCSAFNQPLNFNTINVEIMDSMFQDAVSFARPLNAWNLNKVVSMTNIFTHCGFNQSVYSETLNGWAIKSMYLQRNVDVDLVTDSNNALICHTNAVQAYNLLIGLGWYIVDGGDCTNAPCFLKGTHILTPNGYVRIEKLYAGDVVLTHDGRKVPICKMHRSRPTPSPVTLPYCIPKGTQLHSRRCLDDLYLSPEHAILIHSNKMIAMKYTAFQQIKLQSIHYYHIVLPNYYTDTLIANGIVCESYGSAKKSMKQLHDGKYRTLITPRSYYNITEPSHYKLM